MNHAHLYCKTLAALPAETAINAIHSAYMQLLAVEKGVEGLDNTRAIAGLVRALQLAGHIGFDSPAPAAPSAPVIEAEQFTQKELEEAFNRVKDPSDWKAPIAANVLSSQLDITCEAITHFTATAPRFFPAGYNDARQPIYHVTSPGYRAGPAGDH